MSVKRYFPYNKVALTVMGNQAKRDIMWSSLPNEGKEYGKYKKLSSFIIYNSGLVRLMIGWDLA